VPVRVALFVAAALLFGAAPLDAQAAGGTRVGVVRSPQDAPAQSDTIVRGFSEPGAPITPGRAFFSSLLIPGTGQARLDRPYAGGVFMLVEGVALTMMHRSAEDARIARRFARDSMPLTYQTDPITGAVATDSLGNLIVTSWQKSRYGPGIARARRLHLEDWVAVLFFNHLFSGADAYVAALLWDLPDKVSLRQTPNGTAISTTLWFGRPRRR